MEKVSKKSYLPANELLLKLIEKNKGKFKVTFSITGTALDQFEKYQPEVLASFQKLAKTGCVEFLAETDSHSLSSLRSKKEFFRQVKVHEEKIQRYFGQTPSVFRNTELIYDDGIGQMVYEMGYQAMITEGAKHILGWKSPNYLYQNSLEPKLKLLLKNYQLSDDIAFRFSNQSWEHWPLTADKYASWLNNMPHSEEVVNLFMDYETFGEHQWEASGIFKFMEALPKAVLAYPNFCFSTASEVATQLQPIAKMHVPSTISWADAERDLSAWLGNDLQNDAFESLYQLEEKVNLLNDPTLNQDWGNLQNSDHFYYMCTKFFADGEVHSYFNPYNDPYDAYTNYMNVLSDFTNNVNKAYESYSTVMLTQKQAEDLIYAYEVKVKELKNLLERAEKSNAVIETPQPKPLKQAKKITAEVIVPKETTKKQALAKNTNTAKKQENPKTTIQEKPKSTKEDKGKKTVKNNL
jgi:alpha-amylase